MNRAHTAVSAVSARLSRRRRPTEWGLVADSSRDGVRAELDEGLNALGWRLTLTMLNVELPLTIDGPKTIVTAASLLGGRDQSAVTSLGMWGSHPAELVRDDEFADRAFLIVGTARVVPFRLTFSGETFHGLRETLADIARRALVTSAISSAAGTTSSVASRPTGT